VAEGIDVPSFRPSKIDSFYKEVINYLRVFGDRSEQKEKIAKWGS
jgi:hypothetical protein